MSKMGISTYQSYCGAQIFEAIGLNSAFISKYFTGTSTQIEGIGIDEVAEETLRLHNMAFSDDPVLLRQLDAGGEYAFRVRGEEHMWTPESISKLQNATRTNKFETFKEYAKLINDQTRRHKTLRGLFEIKPAGAAIPILSKLNLQKKSLSALRQARCPWVRFPQKRTRLWRLR